jgi:hypothetical protein
VRKKLWGALLGGAAVLVAPLAFAQGEPEPTPMPVPSPTPIQTQDPNSIPNPNPDPGPAPTTFVPTVSIALERVGGVSFSRFWGHFVGVNTFGLGFGNVAPRLAGDYLVNGKLALGLAVGIWRVGQSENSVRMGSAYSFTLAPRVGYRIAVGRRLDVVPRLGVFTSNGETHEAVKSFAVGVSAEGAFVWRLAESFNVLTAISLDQAITESTTQGGADHYPGGRTTTVQLWLGLGGYL